MFPEYFEFLMEKNVIIKVLSTIMSAFFQTDVLSTLFSLKEYTIIITLQWVYSDYSSALIKYIHPFTTSVLKILFFIALQICSKLQKNKKNCNVEMARKNSRRTTLSVDRFKKKKKKSHLRFSFFQERKKIYSLPIYIASSLIDLQSNKSRLGVSKIVI